MKEFLITVLCLTACERCPADIRWNDTFRETYRSEADDADVAFEVRTPPRVDGINAYPLVVVLNGGTRVSPGEKFPYFQVRPSRNRIWGYRTISTYDAMQVIASMKRNYPIDVDRVYLVGFSAGGSGAMHLASCFPDEFAAVLPLVAAGNNYPLRNFSNLPVAFHHGDRDWTSAICNVRVQAQRMQASGCPTIFTEYAGTGHSVPGSHDSLMNWLFQQRRDPAPTTIRHECEVPSLGRSYWLQIDEFNDPHQRALVDGEIAGDTITIHPKNVARLTLNLDLVAGVKTVRIGEATFVASKAYHFRDGRWQISEAAPTPKIRRYEAGGAANLYQGEPLLIVYGTAGDHTEQLRAAAQKLATYGGPVHETLRSHFPVIADTDLTREQQARCNLILIGKPTENLATAAHWTRLPLSLQDENLKVADRKALKLQDQVLGFLHPNPAHPNRLLYILAPFATAAGLDRFCSQPQRFLAGPDGFDRVSQPDLVVQNLQHQIARQMQFGKDWNWLNLAGADRPIPPRFAAREQLARACLNVMLSQSDADFALWWGPTDRGMWGADFNYLQSFDPASYTLADYRTQHRISETTLGTVRGAELREIWTRWGQNQELISVPEISLAALNDDAAYRLHIPMDLYIKLGQRKKNLGEPQAGPSFTAQEVVPRIFAPQ